ncbi:hypothetical protein OEZ85_002731 [Tetradesmus obliquus]|uniref:Protein ENHANCED DISEASE RESISTANCE 2 C-terminal domain-containing protein n=1 Tax=Tetradesmus obliquus TaxID=3088 RepID=A0ABY8U144_TETOB|nr:hypothetical protein OEZ85_002731 [Tetradesmus obliquus]
MNPAQLDVAEDMLACTAYKATRVADIVCKRRVRLYRDRLLTLHHDSATNSEKVWYLSSSCRLEPEYVDELVPEQRLVRPPGSWSVTTKAFSSGHPIELYCVTIHWPTSWLATRGYTSFTLGFETRQEAAQWHTHVQQHVSSMRLRSGTASKAEPSASASACHSSKPSYDDRAMQWSSGGTTITRKPSQDKGFVAAVLEHWLGSREDKAASLDDTDGSGSAQQYRMPTSPVQIPIPSRPGSAPATMADADAAEYADERAYGQHMRGDDATDASSDGSCSSQDYAPAPNSHEERWVPYRHTNGVAIYHQRQSKCSGLWGDEEGGDAAAGLGVGSEYMASSIVRGSPDECLAVLMDLASNTTILGPASAIELLEDADERQVLRIVVEATGMARRLCAPREVIVERVFKREECGVDGGYTISPREDANGGYSPECLVTCILKVELGGWLGERSWLRPFADALGWVDAYVERMLMAVILVKDEVEQRKFMVQPFSMLTGASRTAAAPESPAGSTAGAATGLQEVTLNGGMAQQQQQQVQWQRSSSKLRQQQQGGILNNTSASSRWQQQQSGSRRQQDGGYSPYGIEQQQYGQQQQMWQGQSMRLAGEQQQLGRGSVGSFKDASRKQLQQQQQAKQKGRLGRMASRIYAMRPKLLRGSSGTSAEQASSAQLPSSLYKESISFNSHITARTADASCSPVTSDAQGHAGFPGLAGAGSAAAAELDLSDPKVLLASAGLPADTQVVQPQYYMGGPQGPAARDATLNSKFWRELHTPGTPAPFKLRGASYLEDRQKVDGGMPQFVLGSVDLVETPGPTQHISRFLPQVRGNQAGYSFVVNLIIPGTPVLSLVAVFINEHHPDILDAPAAAAAAGGSAGASSGQLLQQLDVDGDSDVAGMAARSSASGVSFASSSGLARRSGSSAANGAAGGLQEDDASELEGSEAGRSSAASDYQRPADTSDWQPFDHALHRFLHGDDATRTAMFKLIPHIAEGSWVIKQSVGTVPVILGNKLKTVYYQTDRYIEACCDVTSSSAAAYITGMVRGATKSLVIDLGFVLEGQHSEELPEALLGAFRLNHLDCTTAKKIDTSRELPLLPRPLQHHQLVALQQQAQQQLAAAAAGGIAAAGDASGNLLRPSGNAAVSANGAAGQQEQQQAQGSEQQLDSHHFQALAQRLQQRCRNSLSTVEGSRTMTGHARSRSAASVEELLFSNFLSFSTGGDKGSGGKGCAAAAAAGDGAGPAAGNSSALPHAYGAVSSLSVAATPVGTPPATGNNTPNAAAAAAGSLLGTVHSVSSVGARSGVGVATPTVAAAGVRGHHRTSSNSDCKTPAGAGGAGWPASPPTGSADWSSKLSAAAYISRAHAAALAASAARRSGSQPHHQHSSSSSSNAGGSNAAGSCGWGGGGSGGSKITASEQLRLAKQQQQASAQGFGFRGIWGSGSQGVPSSSGSLSVLSGARQVSAGGGMVGDAGGAAAVAGSGGSPPQQQKRRFSHRRFASLPVNGSA